LKVELVKLISGEEFLASIEEKNGKLIAENPVVGVPNREGGMELMPYAPYINMTKGEDRVIEFDLTHVMFHGPVIDEMKFLEEAYCKHFNKIITPPTGKVIH